VSLLLLPILDLILGKLVKVKTVFAVISLEKKDQIVCLFIVNKAQEVQQKLVNIAILMILFQQQYFIIISFKMCYSNVEKCILH